MGRFLQNRTKRHDPLTAPDEWVVSEGTHDGKALLARFNSGVASAAGHRDFPIQIGVTIPLTQPDERGWPNPDEDAELHRIEDMMVSLIAGRAVLVGVLTTSGVREFVLYTGSSDWIEPFHHELSGLVTTHDVQVMAQTDPDWETYRSFLP